MALSCGAENSPSGALRERQKRVLAVTCRRCPRRLRRLLWRVWVQDTARLLAKVVDVIDPATGTIRLKGKVAAADEMTLDTRSAKTVRVRP